MAEEVIEKDRISELAESRMKEMAEADKQKTDAEPKDAATEESSTETKADPTGDAEEKTEGDKETKADTQEKSDTDLLKAEDKDLTDEEKTRKAEVLKKAEESKSPEDKLKDWQDKTQKRIDELTGDLKAERDGRRQDSDVIKSLEAHISTLQAELEKSGSIESEASRDYKADKERYSQMVEEDKDLPRADRREMSEDELDEYLLENHREANEWLVRRELRRRDEIEQRRKSREAANTIQTKAEAFFKEFPECNQEARHKALMAEGKTNEQALDIIMNESADFKMMMEVIKSNPKFADPNTGPELVAEEMRKRKSSQDSKPTETYTKEDVERMKQEAIEAERQRLASIDTAPTSSNTTTPTPKGSPMYEQGLKLYIQAAKRRGKPWATEKDYQESLRYSKANQTSNV